jgi:CcmD family protein
VTTLLLRIACAGLLAVCAIAGAWAQAPSVQPGGAPEQQEEFIPIDQLPPAEQLPAAPLLVGAYVFVVLALFGYLFSIARRLNAVQREVERLEADLKGGRRG